MSDMDLKVRLTGEAGQLVGQLGAVEAAEQAAAQGANELSTEMKRADKAAEDFARAQTLAKVSTKAAKAAYDEGEISLQEYNRMLLNVKNTLGSFSAENTKAQAQLRNTGKAAQGTGQGVQGLALQFGDFTQQLALGTPLFLAFGQQAGQAAFALQGMGGAAGAVGRFLVGPWGAAVLAGITILGVFATSNKKAEDSARSLGDGIDFQKKSVNELVSAIDDLLEAQKKAIRSSYASEQAALADARASLAAAKTKREQAKAELELALSRYNSISGNSKGGMEAKAGLGALVTSAQAQLDRLDASILKAEQLERMALVPVLQRETAAATDKATAATLKYDKAMADLVARFTGVDAAGKKVNGLMRINGDVFQQEMEKITKTREAETKAAREQEKQAKKTAEAYGGKTLADFGSPISGAVLTSGFSKARKNPVTGKVQPHEGQDWGAPMGTPVFATQDGVVSFARPAGSYGNLIKLGHGGDTETRYGHLSRFNVQEGQQVTKGQTIGFVGSTGRSTGPHLHYEVLVNGKPVDPKSGKFPFDPSKVQEVADKAADQLKDFGNRASETIRQITEGFDAQPRLIDRVAKSTRQLDAIIAELNERKPEGFEEMIADAERAKAVVAESITKPFEQMQEQSERARESQQLLLAGREDEAEALRRIYDLQEQVGFVTQQQRQTILDTVKAEREINEQLQIRQEKLSGYLGAIGDVRSQLEGLLGGVDQGNPLKNFQRSFQQLQGKILTEQLFGPQLRQLEEYVKKRTGIESGVDIMRAGTKNAGEAAQTFADVLLAQARRIADPIDGVGAAAQNGERDILSPEFAAMIAGLSDLPNPVEQQQADDVQEIVVVANKLARGTMALTPAEFFGQMATDLVDPMLASLDRTFGTTFFSQLSGILSGALQGYATGGGVGAVLGGLKGAVDRFGKDIFGGKLAGSISSALGTALGGAQTGTQIAQLGKLLGIKTSKTGGAIGGAVGALSGIPGGELIGSIIGSVVGGLFKKTPKGNVVINETGVTVTGSKKLREGLTSGGNAVFDSLQDIAEQLGGDVGSFTGTIRQKGKKIYANGVRVADMEAAAQKILSDALASGAITGLSAAVSKALASSPDTQKAVTEALKVKQLEAILGGFIGSAQDAFNTFERQAKERLRLATAYGLEINKVEELNAKQRIELRKELEREAFGSLQDLLDSMRSGDLFEGSAVDQRTALLAEIASVRDAAARGDEGAADQLAELLERLNNVSRDVYGTTGGFATDRGNIEQTATEVIALLRYQLDSADPNRVGNLLDENNEQNAAIIAELRRLGIILTGGAPGTGGTPASGAGGGGGYDLLSLAYTGSGDIGGAITGYGGLGGWSDIGGGGGPTPFTMTQIR